MKLNIKNNRTNICRINAEIRQEIASHEGAMELASKDIQSEF